MSTKKKPDPKSPFAALRSVKEELAKKEAEKTEKKAAPAERVKKPAKQTPAEAEDERHTFHRMMSGVMPLDTKKGRMTLSAQAPPSGELVPRERGRGAAARTARQEAAAVEQEEVHAHLRALVEGKQRFEVQDDGRRVEGRRVDLPPDALRKLRRGLVPIDARLDLHGLGASDARTTIEAFLRDKRTAGERCVLVVTGKGEHSPRGQSVLRGEIAAWLSQGAASEHVAAFVTAARDDGGEGAVYVLLRR